MKNNDNYELLNQEPDDEDNELELDVFLKENKRKIIKKRRSRKLAIIKKAFFYLIFLFALITFVFVLYQYNHVMFKVLPGFLRPNNQIYPEWSFKLEAHGTESCIKTYDIDQDGLDDIIFGLAKTESIDFNADHDDKNKRYDGFLMALSGKNGSVLYKIPTKSEIFELNCNTIDINKDGKSDCIASGRRKSLLAFNPLNGSVFWDSSYIKEIKDIWNYYNSIILPYDLNNDGINDIIISTGGNPNIPSDQHDRDPGFILTVSGKTGIILGDIFVFPNKKETYMSPVLHRQKDNSSYLLLGDGGETVAGSLYIISLPNFCKFVMKDKSIENVKFLGEYKSNEIIEKKLKKNKQIDKLYTLHESLTKGVMVPPVLADINKDGTKDIFIVTFDGELIMKDGETFKDIWKRKFECYETYTSPSPGYWNDDDVIDFMLFINLGTFDYYIKSSVLVIDGKNGEIMWQMDTPRMEMISPLTIQTESLYRDLFFFRVQGVGHDMNQNSFQQVFHGLEPQQPIDRAKKPTKRSYDSELSKEAKESLDKCDKIINRNNLIDSLNQTIEQKEDDYHEKLNKPKCENEEFNKLYLTTYGFILDRTIQDSPYIAFTSYPETIMHEIIDPETNQTEKHCVVLEPMERNTGAIGHFSNKDDLDIINIVTYGGIVRDKNGNYLKILSNMKVEKMSIRLILDQSKKLDDDIYKTSIIIKDDSNNENEEKLVENIKDLKFKKKQAWSSYMGTNSDSSFEITLN